MISAHTLHPLSPTKATLTVRVQDSWDRYFQIVPMFPAPTTIDPQISSATAVDPVLAQTMPQEMPPLDAFSNLTFAGGSSTFPGQGFDIPC